MTRPSRTKLARIKLGQFRVLSFALFCLASLGLAAMSGCGDRVSSHGHVINESELKQITIGTTTKADIVQLLGQPSFGQSINDANLQKHVIKMKDSLEKIKENILNIL